MHQECDDGGNIIRKRHMLGYGDLVHPGTMCHFIADDKDIQLVSEFLAGHERHIERKKGTEENNGQQHIDPYSGGSFEPAAFIPPSDNLEVQTVWRFSVNEKVTAGMLSETRRHLTPWNA